MDSSDLNKMNFINGVEKMGDWVYAITLFLLTNFILAWSTTLKKKWLRVVLKLLAIILFLGAILFGLRSMK